MKKRGTIAVLFIMALALSAPVVLAQSSAGASGTAMAQKGAGGRHREHRDDRHDRRDFAFGKLNLTDAQKAGMKQVRENHKATISALHEQIQAKRKELSQATSGGNFNEALATQKLAEMAPFEAKLMAERLAMRQEFMNILTPDQKAQLSQMRTERKAKRANHRNSQQ